MARKGESQPPSSGLFPDHDFDLRPSRAARLRELALSSPVGRPSRRTEELETLQKLRRWGIELGQAFDLRYTSLEAEQPDITEWYGVCYEDGVIRIRLRHARTRRLLKESSLVDTLCHELAHLRYLDHGSRWEKLYRRILERARVSGIYRPGPEEARPRQKALFKDCGSRRRPRTREK
jgi:hypothetical protein